MPEYRYSPLTTVEVGSPMFQGVLMRYGSVGAGPTGPEVFTAGSFGNVEQADILLNVQHDRSRVLARAPGTMSLVDTQSLLSLVAKPPETTEVRDARLLVQAGVLQGLSIEFNAIEEEHRNGLRVISKAELVGVAVVDRPAYPASTVEARSLMGRTLRVHLPTGKKLSCECSGRDCHFASFAKDSVQKALDNAFRRFAAEGDDLVASLHSYDKPIASVSRGSIRRAGKESVDIDLPADEVGRELLAANESAGIVCRPYLDAAKSVGVRADDVMEYSELEIRSLIVTSTDKRQGWPVPEILQTPAKLVQEKRSRWQRGGRRVCL